MSDPSTKVEVVNLSVSRAELRELIREGVEAALAQHTPPSTEAMLSVREAAKLAHLHVQTLRKHIVEGRLVASRVGRDYRVRRVDLDAFIAHGSSDAA